MKNANDCEKMTEGQLLRELVGRFIRYDRSRDKYVDFLQRCLVKAGVEYESYKCYDKLHTYQDERFCQCREIVRVVKKDPYAMLC